VIQGFAPSLVIDLGFVLEGKDGEENDVTMGATTPMLPEQLLCTSRLVRPCCNLERPPLLFRKLRAAICYRTAAPQNRVNLEQLPHAAHS
jgi:hypothetical protein